MPSRVEYEDRLLSCCLVEPRLLENERIQIGLFTNSHAKEVLRSMRALHEAGGAVDILAVNNELGGKLPEIGSYLASLSGQAVTAANVDFYIDRLGDSFKIRTLERMAKDLLHELESGTSGDEALEALEAEIARLRRSGSTFSSASISEALHRVIERAEARTLAGEDSISGICTGFRGLDVLLGGLQNSMLYLVAARTSKGKTSLALAMLRYMTKHKIRAAIASLEMSVDQLMERMLTAGADVPAHRLRHGRLAREDFQKLMDEAGKIGEEPIEVLDQPTLTFRGLRSWAFQAVDRGARVFFVDYLGLLDISDDSKDPRWEKMAEVSRGIKALSRELSVPVVGLVQINREGAKDGAQIGVHQLRDSGALEQDADVVILLEPKDEENVETIPALLRVAKNRNGPCGKIDILFEKSTAKFRDLLLPAGSERTA